MTISPESRARIVIPPRFAAHTVEALGERGKAWLSDLPNVVGHLASRWDLRIGEPFELSYGYVVPALRADGTEAVLKIGVPNDEAPRGAVGLLER